MMEECLSAEECIETSQEKGQEKPLRKRHGARNQHKIKFFLRWLTQTFPSAFHHVNENDGQTCNSVESVNEERSSEDSFYTNSLILDVAGGKGELSARLCFCNQQRVVLVDPRPADIVQCYEDVVFRGLPKKWQTRLRAKQASHPSLLHDVLKERFRQLTMYFDSQTVQRDMALQSAVQNAQIIIGMYADGATEAIVDVALQYQKPFVVVPCCVFPNFFPHRTLTTAEGKTRPVRSYQDFCEYLLQKDPRFQRSVLPFEGRNIAIWWDGL